MNHEADRACRDSDNHLLSPKLRTLCVCVTWALGREVRLPYYDHLRSKLVTSPLSLLLTRIEGYYGLTCSFHPPATPSRLLSDKVMAADFGIVCPLDPIASLASSAPTSAC